ncbi:nucleotide-binding domain-containing protein [Saccharata proteae CBS 121410]|uniref:Nucleotide-binding domain-containing protein n=1 Tax=Saccharata proteae CBS 121410 TaxID=1314787 RepID=A0A9P4LX73_9PEZI|nr:nucleotide-binding domain-containing protein [Saccharata proteae CBS 121410]
MTKVTIIGAGITGLAIANHLAPHHEVTVIARDIPPLNTMTLENQSLKWASPWAGACYICSIPSTPLEQKMQLTTYPILLALASQDPSSSVRKISLHDLHDQVGLEEIWYRDHMRDFRLLDASELPAGFAGIGMSYTTVVLTPTVFLPWLRRRLEDQGVGFVRREVSSLDDVRGYGHAVLVDASGWGAATMGGVGHEKVRKIRGQTHVVRTAYDKILMRQGSQYTYCIPRLDGTAVLGGVKQVGNTDESVDEELRMDIYNRVSDHLPEVFSAFPADFDLVRDNVGIRPGREGGVRVESEMVEGQKVVHAYGVGGGGYAFSFGLAKAVGELVEQWERKSGAAAAKL